MDHCGVCVGGAACIPATRPQTCTGLLWPTSTLTGAPGEFGSRKDMAPPSEYETIAPSSHAQPSCWSSVVLPRAKVTSSASVAASTILQLLSADAVRILALSAFQQAPMIEPACTFRSCTGVDSFASNVASVMSDAAEKKRLPSGEYLQTC